MESVLNNKPKKKSIFARGFAFDISVIFSTLLLTTSFTIIFYTYHKHSQSASIEAQNKIQATNKTALSEVNGYLKPGNNAQLLASLFDEKRLTQAAQYKSIMRNILVTYPSLESVYVGEANGNTLFDIRIPPDPKKLMSYIPIFVNGAAFVTQAVKKVGNKFITTWVYEDKYGKILKKITNDKNNFYSPDRPWYKGAMKNAGYWIGMYQFFGIKKSGITVSYPIIRNEKKLGVVGVDFSAEDIYLFLTKLKTKNFENIYLMDHENELIKTDESSIPAAVLLKNISSSQKGTFVFNKTSYIYETSEYITDYGAKWQLVGIIKLDSIISNMLKTNEFTLTFSLVMLFLTSCLLIYFARKISRPIHFITNETKKLQHLSFDGVQLPHSNIIEINEMSHALSLTKSALLSFSKYLPFSLVEKLMMKGMTATLGGEKRILSIMFSDITNFTNISEKLNVEELVSQLSEYLDALTKVIHRQHGTVDKYLGDGIMAFWGAPILDPEHVKNACLSALLCREKVRSLNRNWEKNNKPLFHTRFGLHTGEVIIGNIGSSDRLNYTAIGDNVNLASRLEGINKQYSTEIIVSQDIVDQVSEEFLFRPLGLVAIKGKQQPLFVYELLGAFAFKTKNMEERQDEVSVENSAKDIYIH